MGAALRASLGIKVHGPQRLIKELKELSEKSFDWTGIDFPTPLEQLDRIERQNPDYGLYVYGYDEEEKYPFSVLGTSENEDAKMKVTIILFRNKYTSHYAWISKFNTLIRSEVTKDKNPYVFCLRYLWLFKTKEKLEEHLKDCSKFGAVRIEMPIDKDGKPKHPSFDCKKYSRKMLVTHVVYADMESNQRIPNRLFSKGMVPSDA